MCKCRSFGRRKRINLTNKIFLPHAAPVRRRAFRYNQVFFSAVGARRHGLRIACGCVPRRERSLRRSSSPKKVTPRLCCSLVNALATLRLATNFFRYQAVGYCAFPPVGNAHRAFRGGKRVNMPFGRATGKHYIIEKIHNKLFQPI